MRKLSLTLAAAAAALAFAAPASAQYPGQYYGAPYAAPQAYGYGQGYGQYNPAQRLQMRIDAVQHFINRLDRADRVPDIDPTYKFDPDTTLAILAGFFAVMLIVASVVPEQENEMLRMLKSSKAALYTIAMLSVVTAPVVEEVVYRGVLYSAFQRSVGKYLAVGLTTLLFALVHVPQYWPSFSTIFLLTLLSLILTLLRAQSGNLWPCIVLHTLFNGFQSALLIAEPHINVPGSPTEQAVGILIMYK